MFDMAFNPSVGIGTSNKVFAVRLALRALQAEFSIGSLPFDACPTHVFVRSFRVVARFLQC